MISIDQRIIGGPHVNSTILFKWLQQYAPAVPDRDRIASVYTTFGELTGIGNVLPFAQAAKETGWFKSERWVKSFNPAGLGATNDGAWGGHFDNPAEGVLAQYAHLLAYAIGPYTEDFLLRGLQAYDPRYSFLPQAWLGKCPRWIDLNSRWAFPGTDYGQSIIARANTLLAGIQANEVSILKAA